MVLSYPFPEYLSSSTNLQRIPTLPRIVPKPLHVINPPSKIFDSQSLPQLPCKAEERLREEISNNILPGFVLSTHIFPAASPRTKCQGPPKITTFPQNLPNRQDEIFNAAHRLLQIRRPDQEVIYDTDDTPPMWIVANRFTNMRIQDGRTPRENLLTLVILHANGFHKETWEESLKATISKHEELTNVVAEFWLLDAVNHGDSSLLNESHLGEIFNWADNTRDVLNLLINFMPELPGEILNTHLPAISVDISKRRQISGFPHRKILGLGHSLGGACVIRAAMELPSLFTDILLVDPVVVGPYVIVDLAIPTSTLLGAIGRRVEWPSSEEAHASFMKNPFFSNWDPRVLQSYVDFALTDNTEGSGVRLKTSGYQEAVVFAERRLPGEVWEMLKDLPESVEVRWIMSGKENYIQGGYEATQETVWRPAKTSNIRLNAGHLITQVIPHDLGEEIGNYISRKYVHSRFVSKL